MAERTIPVDSPPPVPLAIIGIGCLFPRAQSSRGFWLNIKNGVDAVGPVPATHWSATDFLDTDPKAPDHVYTARGAFLDAVDFNPLEFGIAPNDLEAIDTSQLLGLVAARQALVDAGYGPEKSFDRNRVSVVLGVTGTLELVIPLGARLGHPKWRKALSEAGVDSDTAEDVVARIADSYVGWQENSFPGLLGNVVAGRIANRLDLGGTNCVVDAACASSLSAIHLAGLELATGRCDVAVTGGIDTFNDIFMFTCFSKTPALSPSGNAKPFDAGGDGTILGEGLGIVVLKRLADAERDGDRVYAVLRSMGTSSDGKGNAIYAPSANGQMKALRNAYQLAGITPDTIRLVEGHGTGTRVGDTVEATALSTVYSHSRAEVTGEGPWCAVGSVKSQIGHTKAAAGAAGLIKAALALHYKTLPPTIKVQKPVEPFLSANTPFYVNVEKRPWIADANHPRRAAVSAFGFGGSNFHCVLEEHQSAKTEIDWDGEVEIIAIQGENPKQIADELNRLPKETDWSAIRVLARQSRELPLGNSCRLLLVLQRGITEIAKLLATARTMLERQPDATYWHSPDGAYFGRGAATGKLAVLFPGQGSQYVGMLRDLACLFPEMQSVLADANRVFDRLQSDEVHPRLSDAIYPISSFEPEARTRHEQKLRETQVAQPAIGAVSLGALKVLESFGLQPEMYAGHSYGELPALCAAGCFADEELHQLSRLRGHLMASFHGRDAGAMLAVHSPRDTIETVLREEALTLVIANRNAPSQLVLSGTTTEIDRAGNCLTARNIRSTRLPVAAAFHSPLVAPAQVPFLEALEGVTFCQAKFPVFANSSSRQYPEDPNSMRQLLAEQLAKPVDFVQQIGNMVQEGVRTFLEVGPGSTLTRLVESILKAEGSASSGWDAFALDASSGKRSGTLDLAHTLARLAARGCRVELARWEAPPRPTELLDKPRPGLTVPICGANYVKPRNRPERQPKAKPIADSTPQPRPSVSSEGKSMTPVPPTPPPSLPPANASALTQALQFTQQSLAAFQNLQEQTAQLHRQFLQQQEAAQKTLQLLVEQQQSLLLSGIGARPLNVAVPSSLPELPKLPPAIVHAPLAIPTAPPLPPTILEAKPTAKPVVVPPQPLPISDPSLELVLLQVVAEKTGYPVEMLSAEMALDSDLGIDSIKRVEILSTLQERLPNAPAVKAEQLGSFHTLQDIIAFLGAAIPAPIPQPASVSAAVTVTPQMADMAAESVLLGVVAEKTGYPVEMLSLDLALDADLGIDSIKRVEILSTLQERLPGIPAVRPDQLGTFHNLRDIVTYLQGDAALPLPPAPAPIAAIPELPSKNGNTENTHSPASTVAKSGGLHDLPEPISVSDTVEVERSVLRRIPLNTKKPRNKIALTKGSPVWVIADPSSLTAKLSQFLDSLGYRPQCIPWNDSPYAYGPRGVAGLVLVAPEGLAPDDFHLRAFRWMKHASTGLLQAARQDGAVFTAITRLDGSFGFGNLDPARDPSVGVLAGLVKTAAREWPDVTCKVIDCDPITIRQLLPPIIEEMFLAGPVEVGVTLSERWALELVDAPLGSVNAHPLLDANDVVLITGGARGVTAAAAQAIAESSRSTLVLLGRTPKLEHEPDWLATRTTEADIKKALSGRLGPDLTPRDLEKKYRQLLAQREARATVQRLQTAGSKVVYWPVDVQDTQAVQQALAEIRRQVGRFTALVHGAGVLADRRIEDLTDDQFESVYATKVLGLRNILLALGDDPLKALVLFSSSTGRFGRVGQSAYAGANEVLNKAAHQQARLRPGCRVVAMNWGPWDGGMVTPGLQKLFESEGVGTIPLRKGGDMLIQELTAADRSVETIVIAKVAESKPTVVSDMAPGVPAAPDMAIAFERTIRIVDHPILNSHIIDGRAVVPMALHLEWLAHAALHANPGMVFQGVNDLRVHQGIYVDEGNSVEIRVLTGKASKRDQGIRVPVEIRGRRENREVVHARAEILLGNQLPLLEKPPTIPKLDRYPQTIEEAYSQFLFHGPDLQCIESIDGIGEKAIVVTLRTAPLPTTWMENPLRGSWLTDPLVLDGSFQALILWTTAKHGSGSLPCYFGRYRQFRRTFTPGSVRVSATVTKDSSSLARANIDFLDSNGELLAQMQDYEFVIDPALNDAFRRNQFPQLVT